MVCDTASYEVTQEITEPSARITTLKSCSIRLAQFALVEIQNHELRHLAETAVYQTHLSDTMTSFNASAVAMNLQPGKDFKGFSEYETFRNTKTTLSCRTHK